ncbi:MAG: AMP-binding protein [Candidatus Symbiothrix sp.]|jgi:long-chain acyl-CoA synthetase|nr:AMP-binding protein [Candidatus Symbiothrix sp.]
MQYTENFIELYEQTLRRNFALNALSDYGTNVSYTYGGLAQEIEKLHILFEEKGIGQGDKVALIGKNCSYWGVVFLATVSCGAVIIPILQDFSPEDVHNIINHSGTALLFASDSILKNLDVKKMNKLKSVFPFGDNGLLTNQKDEDLQSLNNRLNEKFSAKYPDGFTEKDIKYTQFPNENTVVLNYTSGTTGFSKGVLITGDNLVGNLVFARETIKLQRGDEMVSLLPLAHAYGCAFEFLFPLLMGCHVTLLGKTPAPNILMNAFAQIKPALIIAVPLILEKIYKRIIFPLISKKLMAGVLKIPFLNGLIYATIKKKLIKSFGGNFLQIIIGGAPLSSEVEEFLLKIKFPISVGYGMTECAPLVSFSMYKDYVPLSCGKVLPNVTVRIDSPDPYHIAGEIQVKGQNVTSGYYNNEKANENIFTDDGWLRTGDLGTTDKDGNIFIRGRSKNMILSPNGQNIYPEEIEAKLNNLPFVTESLVISRKGKLLALVYPDYDAAKQAGIPSDKIQKAMDENLQKLNKTVASYEKVAEIQIYPNEFEKTPKKSIKRYLYDN